MIGALIRWSAANRLFVVLGALALVVAGFAALRATPIDALPDLSDTQVIIRTSWPGQAPQIVENQVTYPWRHLRPQYRTDLRTSLRRYPCYRICDRETDDLSRLDFSRLLPRCLCVRRLVHPAGSDREPTA